MWGPAAPPWPLLAVVILHCCISCGHPALLHQLWSSCTAASAVVVLHCCISCGRPALLPSCGQALLLSWASCITSAIIILHRFSYVTSTHTHTQSEQSAAAAAVQICCANMLCQIVFYYMTTLQLHARMRTNMLVQSETQKHGGTDTHYLQAVFIELQVHQTLIRAYFSPAFTTGQRFIYAGSADSCVYIWDVVTGTSILDHAPVPCALLVPSR